MKTINFVLLTRSDRSNGAQSKVSRARSFGRLILWVCAGLAAVIGRDARGAAITFDLNQADAALAGTPAPYATVSISTQGTGMASFSVVADGPYSLGEALFAVNPGVIFLPQPVAQSTGAMPFGDIGVVETTLGAPGTTSSVMTDQFGGFGFGYGSQFGTVKSISFTLTGPFINNIASVIRPNGSGFLAGAKIYDGITSGFVAGNGSPAPVAPAPEPRSIFLAVVFIAMFMLWSRARRHHYKRLISISCFALAALAAATNAPATTIIDTFRFTQDGWTTVAANAQASGLVAGDPVPRAILAGAFTGTEEADGRIQLADLTSFVVDYTDSTMRVFFSTADGPPYLFSYNPNGGASGLTYAVTGGTGISIACAGAAASLYPMCLALHGIQNPQPTNGAIFPLFLGTHPTFQGEVVTANFPVVTLISRTTVVDPVNAPEPCPAALLFLGATLVMALRLCRRFRRIRLENGSHS
jgi:hypothetical protein